MKATKITRPMYIGNIGPQIANYCKKVDIPNMAYETLYQHMTNMVQFGGDLAEVWVVFNEDKPVCFATWVVESNPVISTAFWDHIYKWTPDSEPVLLLGDEFLKFAKRNRCEFLRCRPVNTKVAGLFKKYAADKGVSVEEKTETILFARRS